MDLGSRGWKLLNLAKNSGGNINAAVIVENRNDNTDFPKMLGDSSENIENPAILFNEVQNVDLVMELDNGESVILHDNILPKEFFFPTENNNEGDILRVAFEGESACSTKTSISSVLQEKKQDVPSPRPRPSSVQDKDFVENERLQYTDVVASDSDFRPSDNEFDSESTSNNDDFNTTEDNNIDVAEDLIHLDSEGRGEEREANQQKKRNIKAKPEEWQCNENRFKRMKGEEYIGIQKDQSGKKSYRVDRTARKMGQPCSSNECRRIKTRLCSSILETDRERLFARFWKEMDWKQRQVYINGLVSFKERKRVRKNTDSLSRRKGTLHYNLKINTQLFPVCKTLFLSTFGLKEWTVRNWVLKSNDGILYQNTRTNLENNNTSRNVGRSQNREFAVDFLKRLPKMPSHYCRSSTSKEYLEPVIESKSELHRIYLEACQNEGRAALARKQFLEEFKNLNLGLFQPKKDQCDTCIGYKHKQVSEEVYAQHVKRKDEKRELKAQEKDKAIRGEQLTYTMDLQAVKLSPMLKASALYYKMKLCVHNFTLHNIATKDVTCYLWNESEGGLVAAVFASCVLDFLEKEIEKHQANSVVIISDGCTYQNRNAVLGNALLKFAIENKVTITQHYLEKGHTQMEVDSVHSTIEVKLKNKEIYLPSDYARICREVRPKQPYHVNYLDQLKISGEKFNHLQELKKVIPSDCHRFYDELPHS